MFKHHIPARVIAKWTAETIVAANVTAATQHALTEYTEIDTDSKPVEVGTGLFGWYVSQKLSPVTDAIVDRTADRVVAWKNRKNQTDTAE